MNMQQLWKNEDSIHIHFLKLPEAWNNSERVSTFITCVNAELLLCTFQKNFEYIGVYEVN